MTFHPSISTLAIVAIFMMATGCARLQGPSLGGSAPVVQTDDGPIMGMAVGEQQDVHVFKGIPFAAPPVAENRWRAAQPVVPWTEVRDCTEFGPACPQTDALSRIYGAKKSVIDEDCLYLNVFTPVTWAGEGLPVMVWFYGGGFVVGDAAAYDMSKLCREGAVVVTVNYRVNVFGFLAHELLTAESPHHSSGNYAVSDMIAGLQWVQRNISEFGGSADNVTIFGQSAGGSAVCLLMASPRTDGLFHKAISQSNGAYFLDDSLASAEEKGAIFFKALGVDKEPEPLAAARAKPWQEVFEVANTLGRNGQKIDPEGLDPRLRINLDIDGWLLTDTNPQAFADGRQKNVPLLIGSNADESDRGFTAGARYFARRQVQVNPNVYRYFFSQPSKSPLFAGQGAAHAAEIPYMTKGNGRIDQYFDDYDWYLCDVISKAWVQFARTGNPNIEGQPFTWPIYDVATDPYLEIGPEIKQGTHLRTEICDRIDELLAREMEARRAQSAK